MNAESKDALARALHDIHLAQTAAFYDLTDKRARKRSVDDLEWLFFQLVKAVDPGVFIEAGAKDGRVSLRARRYLPEARIVAFEANPHTFERFLPTHVGAPNPVEYLHLAVSDRPGKLSFNIPTRIGGASIDVDVGRSSLLKRLPDPDESYVTAEVEATTLDLFFRSDAGKSNCMWVDVEGANRDVLSGAKETLKATQVLLIEVEDRPIWTGQWLRPDVQAFLYQVGFVPVARDYQSRYQFNILFLRSSLIDNDRFRYLLTSYLSRIGQASLTGRSFSNDG